LDSAGEKYMTDYTYTTYNTAQFHIPEGMYSIEEIEELLAYMKAAIRRQDKHLKASLQPLKERNT
jgi:hypothetical protein